MRCKFCRSIRVVKNGKTKGKQRYLCKTCGKTFVEGDRPVGRPESGKICSIPGCDKPVHARDMCKTDYARWLRSTKTSEQ